MTNRQRRAELLRLTQIESMTSAKLNAAKLLKKHRCTDELNESIWHLENEYEIARDNLREFRGRCK